MDRSGVMASSPSSPAGDGAGATARLPSGFDLTSLRFALAWLLPLGVAAAAWRSPWAAWAALFGWQVVFALLEFVPALKHSPPAVRATAWHRFCIRFHVPLQAALLSLALWLLVRAAAAGITVSAKLALGIAVGGVTGSQGITFAHELGHSRSRFDRVLGLVADDQRQLCALHGRALPRSSPAGGHAR